MNDQIKDTILSHIEDCVSDFLYYDRKECEDLPMGEIEKAIENGVISIDDMVSVFRAELEKNLL